MEYDGAGHEGLMECARKVCDVVSSKGFRTMMKFGVIISMGNDIMVGAASPDPIGKVAGGMHAVDAYMRQHRVSSTLLVFGGASGTWSGWYATSKAVLHGRLVTGRRTQFRST